MNEKCQNVCRAKASVELRGVDGKTKRLCNVCAADELDRRANKGRVRPRERKAG